MSKTYTDFMNESLIDNDGWKEIALQMNAIWDKKSNGGRSSLGLGALGGNSIVGALYIGGNDKDEHSHGILQNDPLNVRLYIEQLRDGTFVIEPHNKSIHVNPDSLYLVYSSHKFKLRKTKAKTPEELVKKFEKNFVDRIVADIKTLVKAGDLDVHSNTNLRVGGSELDLIKKRYK